MFCPYCGKEISNDVSSCTFCGKEINSEFSALFESNAPNIEKPQVTPSQVPPALNPRASTTQSAPQGGLSAMGKASSVRILSFVSILVAVGVSVFVSLSSVRKSNKEVQRLSNKRQIVRSIRVSSGAGQYALCSAIIYWDDAEGDSEPPGSSIIRSRVGGYFSRAPVSFSSVSSGKLLIAAKIKRFINANFTSWRVKRVVVFSLRQVKQNRSNQEQESDGGTPRGQERENDTSSRNPDPDEV